MACLFCNIIEGSTPSTKVYENEKVYAFEDISPQAPVHILVVHKTHTKNIDELNEDNASIMGDLFLALKEITRLKGIDKEGYRVIINNGTAGGQVIWHLHVHIMGGKRWAPWFVLTCKMRRILLLICLCMTMPLQGRLTLPENSDGPVDTGKFPGAWQFFPADNVLCSSIAGDSLPWQKIKKFPHDWRSTAHNPWSNTDIAWYRLKIFFPRKAMTGPVMIRLGPVNDADETYLNGKLIGKSGAISSEGPIPAEHAWDRVRLYSLPGEDIQWGKENIIAVRIQRFFPREAGFRIPGATLIIGKGKTLRRRLHREQIIDAALIALLAGAALYFLILAFRQKSRENFDLALSGFLLALYSLTTSQLKYLLELDFLFAKRLQFISITMIFFIFGDFIYYRYLSFLNGRKFINFLAVANFTILIPLMTIPVFSGDMVLWDRAHTVATQPAWLIPLTLTGMVLYIAVKKGNTSARILLGGYLLAMAAGAHDLLLDWSILSGRALAPLVFLLLMMSVQQFDALPASKKQSKKTKGKGSLKEGKGGDLPRSIAGKLEEVIRYMKINFPHDLSREALAAKCNLSPDYFSRLFKVHTGKSFSSFLTELRVEEAKCLLKQSDEKIIDIAHASGFENLRTFNRSFQGVTGMTPSSYRER